MALLGEKAQVHYADIIVIITYFILVLSVGLISAYRSARGSVSVYFLAGRNVHWTMVGATLFVSNIGSEHFVGLAGSGAASGIAIAGFELNAMFVVILLGWAFVPVYIACGVDTMPEYMKRRFGGKRIRVYLSFLALLLYIFTKISVDLYSGALFIKQSFDWNLYVSVVILLVVAGLFTVLGGLTAVIWTDAVQIVITLSAAIVLMVLTFKEVGGFWNLLDQYNFAVPSPNYTVPSSSCGIPRQDWFHLLRDPVTSDLPWTGMIFGLTVSAVWYWCTDQVIVQRALSAKNYSHAKGGCIMAGWLKFLPLWLIVFPGMAARVLYPDQVACSDPDACYEICQSRQGCSNIAYPLLVVKLLPAGLRGLMLAAMMSALMDSLTAVFNSSSTIFTMDVWKALIRKNAGTVEQLIVGKAFVVLMVVIGIIWIPIIDASSNSELFVYIQNVTSCLSPPICACFVMAIFVKRVNESGAFWGLMVGLVIGIIRFALQFSYKEPSCWEEDFRPSVIAKIHYLHFGLILFLICCIVIYVVSLLSPPMDPKRLARCTYWTRHDPIAPKTSTENVNIPKVDDADKKDMLDSMTSAKNEPKTRDWKRFLKAFCGVEDVSAELAKEEQEHQLDQMSLKEDPKWKILCNIQAVLLLTVAVFVWGFFS